MAWLGWDGSALTSRLELIVPDNDKIINFFCDYINSRFGRKPYQYLAKSKFEDGKDIVYSGNSIAHDPKGQTMVNTTDGEEKVLQTVLSKNELEAFRKKFPVALDADQFRLL